MRNYESWALGISILVHACILTGLPNICERKIRLKEKKEVKEIRIVTQKIEKIVESKSKDSNNLASPLPYMENLIMKKLIKENKKTLSLNKPQIVEKNIKKIILYEAPEDKNLKKIPAYMDYYRLIRKRIKDNAYRYYDSKNWGEVSLSFTVLADGSLENLRLNEEHLSGSGLGEIALRSVKDAAPFPAFFKELKDYARLQFNISIHFKNN